VFHARSRRSSMLGTAIATALLIAGCSTTVDQRGNLPDEAKLELIRPGITSKETVSQLLGTPSSTSTFDSRTWYYISRRTEQFAFFKPDLLDQQVVTVTFDENGVVQDVTRRGMEDRREVSMVTRVTPTPGRELGFMEQLVGNLGRFNAADSSRRQNNDNRGPTP
jgi:outer membrane protein assembly factor BamE (lipoprotein component of BamABCDE complex)